MEKTYSNFTVRLPASLVKLWKSLKKETEEAFDREIAETFVLSLVKKHQITASKGAELLGISYRDFLALMDDYGVPVLDYPKETLKDDAQTLS